MDIGTRIREVVKAQGMEVPEFADRMCVVRSNIYHLFRRKYVDTATLQKASQVLRYNFFTELAKEVDEELAKLRQYET